MDEAVLLMEVGSQAIEDLSESERELILATYSDSQVRHAAIKVFDLLVKKFQPNYRMGKTYENLSQKYENYRRVLNDYLRQSNAGRVGNSDPTNYDVSRTKWVEPTR